MPTLRGAPFIPTTSRSGNAAPAIFRAKNMLLRGKRLDQLYLEVYSGNRDMSENIPESALTGTVSHSGGQIVTGSATAFKSELHIGQMLLVGAEYCVVSEVLSDTSFKIVGFLFDTVSGATAYRLPILFEVNEKRGSMIWGNALEFDKGTILGVGDGTLRLNGATLSGTSFVAARTPKIAIFNPANGQYGVFSLGFARPAAPTLAAIAGGVKNMQGGTYSIMLAPARIATNGYTNPSPKVEVTISTGQKIEITLLSADSGQGQNAWKVFGTLFTANQGVNGPWYQVKRGIPAQDLLRIVARGTVSIQTGQATVTGTNTFFLEDLYAGDTVTIDGNSYVISSIASNTSLTLTANASTTNGTATVTITKAAVEWNDAEISRNDLLEFDNFPPPEAEFVASLGGFPIYGSCFGRSGGSPGPNIVPAKPLNIEAALVNLNLRLDPAHTIVGWTTAQGRLFLTTINSLQIGTLAPAGPLPITTRPFWRSGFHNPYSLVFVNGRLYGWTHNGPTRSVYDGEKGSEEFSLNTDVREILKAWNDGKVFVAHDPVNDTVCYIHSADRKNAAGFWKSVILPYSLAHEQWMPPIELDSATMDMVITGIATVKNRLYFIAGGRLQAGGRLFKTFEFDSADFFNPNTVPYFVAWQYSDEGAEDQAKRIKGFRVTGQFQTGKFAIYAENEDGKIEDDPFEDPAKSISGDITITTANLKRGEVEGLNLREVNLWTARISGEWIGTVQTPRDRIDEVYVRVNVRRTRR